VSPPVPGRIRPGGVSPTRPATDLSALKAVVRAELRLTCEDVVLVSELRCAEAGCPPVETVVVVLDTQGHRTWKLPQAPEEVTPHTLRHTLATNPEGQALTHD
jgi:hypothetical protein